MKKKVQTFRNLITRYLGAGLLVLCIGLASTHAQTYLTENFDGTWAGSPSAPAGWTQERVIAVAAAAAVTPAATGTGGEKDWQQSTWNGSAWSPTPYGGAPTVAPISGSSALSLEDGNFNASGTARSERRLLSPITDLTTSTSPYVRFWYYNNQIVGTTANVRIIISNDGGVTWKTLSNVINGFTTTNLTWNRINILIPAAYRVANAKIGISIVNRYGSADPFIDDVTIEDYTPTTITSAANGDWNVGATWVGGVVPTADNHVVIAHNVVVTNTATSTGILARCQNLTVNSGVTLSHGAGTANLLHVFGNLDISGTFNAFNGTSGRMVYVNGNVTINVGGTANLNTSTTACGTTLIPTAISTVASGFVFLNADAASFTNNGTLTNNRINNVWHLGSGTFTYNNTVGVPFTFGLFDGFVNPNGNLTLGNAAAATIQNIIRQRGEFTTAPTFSNTNITQRNMQFYTTNFADITPVTLTTGEEIHNNSGRIVTGQFQMNTFNNVTLGYPLTIGTATTGSLTLTKGIIITSNTNLLTTSLFFAPPAGANPSTATPSTTNGSYIVGPLRVNFPATGTTTRNFPLGLGTAFNTVAPTSNARRNIAVATTTAWASQSITGTIEGTSPSGAVTGSLTKIMGNRLFRLNLNGGADLPATATVSITGQNNTLGSTDNLQGNVNNLFVAQSTTGTSGWAARSASSGTGAFVNNTDYTRVGIAAAPGPVAPLVTNGEYFAFGTDAVIMTYTAGDVERNTNDVSPGAFPNTQILRIKVTTTGVVPINITTLNLSTAGTTNVAKIDTAKVWYTGTSSTFAMTTQYGVNQVAPSGSFAVNGNTVLATGDNYFWLTYDIGSTNALNDSFAAECASVVVDGITQTLTSPAAGYRISNLPMTYVSSTSTTPFTSKVAVSSTNNAVLGVEVVMSAVGSPVIMTSFDVATTGTTLLTNITNLKVWYTGSSNTFATTTQFGTTVATPAATQTVSGSVNLTNNTNYFWVTYDIAGAAVVNDSVDAECTGINVSGSPQIPTVNAPAGNRKIKGAYCVTSPTGSPYITNVTLGSMNYNPATGTAVTTISPGVATTTLVRGTVNTFSVTTDGSSDVRAWIDYNDNGTYEGSEIINIATNTVGAGLPGSTTFTIPCNAQLGPLNMRINIRFTANPNTDPCRVGGSGASQNYIVTIVDNPLAYSYSTASQQTGVVAPNTLDRAILFAPVRVNGCGDGVITEMRFSTTGSTAPADITNAKLYRTTGNTFNTSNLRATVASPSGQFTFTLTDTVVINDTTRYWLAYDIAPGATITNTIDATFDSLQIFSNYYVPTVSAPSGSILIDAPMTYTGSVVTAGPGAVVFTAETNRHIIGYQLSMSAIGSSVNLTSLDLNLNGTTDTADIQNIKVWYTGNSSTFATTTQFGATLPYAPAVASPFTSTFTGSLPLLNNVNYFWVTYDIKSGATALNVVDGEITQVVVAGNTQIPSITAPAGNRQIRVPYCAAAATNTADTDIGRIQLFDNSNTLIFTNGSELPTYLNPAANGLYTNFTGLTPANLTRGVSHSIRMDQITSGATLYAAGLIVYIDWNDDGDFLDASETAYTSGGTLTVPATGPYFLQGSFTVPCSAVLGNLRMRVILQENTSATLSCGTFLYGEVEDYTINVLDNPLVYSYSNAIQQTGTVAPNTLDQKILHLPVRVNGCGVATITEMRFSTTGSTSVSDITNAKLYRTAGNTFNTSNLRSTVAAPSGQFTFIITDTLVNNDTTNYWLAYDIAPGATLTNIADATFDSLQVLSNYYVPTVSAPSGNILIDAPMSYTSSTTTQTLFSKVETSSSNNQIIGIQVVTSAIGSPVNLTQLDLNVTGTTDTADIQNVKVWYTGNSSTFDTTTQFGTTIPNIPTLAYSVTGSVSLLNNTNYFWVTYDIKPTATVLNLVDAECTSITVAGSPQTPTVTAPAGDRQIRGAYCASGATFAGDEEIYAVSINGVSNGNNPLVVAPGPGSILSMYSNFTTLPSLTTVNRGNKVNFNVTEDEPDGATYYDFGTAIFIDFNQDGDFADAGERVFAENATLAGPRNVIGTFYIPLTATLGETRMRVMVAEGISGAGLIPCLNMGYGETEDYIITIGAAPAPTAYTWNQTLPASFNTAANWTPTRTVSNLQDELIFNSGTAVTVNDVQVEIVSKLNVGNSTVVTLNASTVLELIVSDSLTLAGKLNNTNTNMGLVLGTSALTKGSLAGSGSIQGSLTRWVDSTTSAYSFPLSINTNNRAATITYTVPPTTSGKLTVSYLSGAPGTAGLPLVDGGITFTTIADAGIWSATPTTLAGGTFDITMNADSIKGVNNFTQTALLVRPNNSSNWLASGTLVTTTGSNLSMVLSRTGLTGYGEVGIAGDASNPLPVTLTTFTGTTKDKDAQLNWATATESNNAGFDLERSLDGRTFSKVTFVKGAGNSNRALTYNYKDVNAFAKATVLYYRLKQVDFDGKFTYSQVVKVTANTINAQSYTAYPNPFTSEYSVALTATVSGVATIETVDIQGRLVSSLTTDIAIGNNVIPVKNVATINPGVYFVRLTFNGETQVTKLVKN